MQQQQQQQQRETPRQRERRIKSLYDKEKRRAGRRLSREHEKLMAEAKEEFRRVLSVTEPAFGKNRRGRPKKNAPKKVDIEFDDEYDDAVRETSFT